MKPSLTSGNRLSFEAAPETLRRGRGTVSSSPEVECRRIYSARNAKLRQLGYDSYSAYLRSSHWKRLRNLYYESDLPQACVCGETRVQLHHVTYERVGAEELIDLTPLCNRCHGMVHVLERRGDLSIDLVGLCDEERAATYRLKVRATTARRAAEDAQMAAETAARVESLPVHEQVRVLQQLAIASGVNVRDEVRMIKHATAKMYRKVVDPEQRAA